MNEMNEIKIPKGVDRISVKQHEDKIVIEFIPEKPRFEEGDFVYEDGHIMIVKSYPNNCHANAYPEYSDKVSYNSCYGVDFSEPTFRYATEEEKQLLIDALAKQDKRLNAEKKCIEDIPNRKFKAGDKVKIKDGISSKTHGNIKPIFTPGMDAYIGRKLTVKEYIGNGRVIFSEDIYGPVFDEDWLEPWSDEPKNGDLAIFWDNGDVDNATIRLYDKKGQIYHCDSYGSLWGNAIKFESKEQFEKVIRGEI